ncbi:PL29 family lyase N-terminal domain-containing protein [Phocaeicola barnesiae]|uniref:PL29 family lyase N-terminal domain-containing protein n=1 Tax=Phocaeicola barnesiae TaxID=376804 RepID=UPI0025A3900B|nr:PL29 family lyase N-terminal domain-containing protein [Phocaeicola barnesiae]MDM8309624.1 PL29 family lyase N-terminal domain-containing protein [Phocaeicola barnesiae]
MAAASSRFCIWGTGICLSLNNLSFLIYKLKFFTIMRKKYLSALLFGALLFASAGTFTSCKDYDDDINNLQSQITANADAIKALQDLVNNGDYVTNIEKSAEGLVVTFKNAGAQTITLEDKVGSVVTVNEEGVLCIDGEPTDIKAATADPDGEATKSQIIIGEDNCWQVLQEDGTYKTTNIPVSGVNVSGSEAEGYTLTIFDETGTPTTVKLPSAASSISEIVLAGDDQTAIKLSLSSTEFNLTSTASGFNAASFRSNWKGAKTLPADLSYIIRPDANADDIQMRVNPVDVDASVVTFKLTNSLNQDLDGMKLVANPENTTPAAGAPDGRSAAKGGLYTMYVQDMILT